MPVGEGIVLALLLRQLLRIQPPGEPRSRTPRAGRRRRRSRSPRWPFRCSSTTSGSRSAGRSKARRSRGCTAACRTRACSYCGGRAARRRVRAARAEPGDLRLRAARRMRIFNWYLYTYLTCGVAMLRRRRGGCRRPTIASLEPLPRASSLLPAGAVILLFLLLNIEIADFYATGPEITFRFGVTLAQDLTYTIGWLVFGLGAADGGDLPAQSRRANRRRRAHRGDDVQGVPLRLGIARRAVSRGIARRPRGVALARRAGAAEVRAASRPRKVP